MGLAGRLGAGMRRMTCPHAAMISGGAKAAADLCKETGPRRGRAGQAGAWAVKRWRGRLALLGRALLSGWRAAVLAVPGRDQTAQKRNISLALDTARIYWQTLLQAVAREQAGGLDTVGPTG